MLSVRTQAPSLSLKDGTLPQHAQLSELSDLNDAVAAFTNLTVGAGTTSIRLHCTIPTWSYSDTCLDLHDLHELRSRFLLFIHDLLESLRASGVSASYSLAPSSSSLCLVCCKPVNVEVLRELHQSSDKLKRKQAALVNLEEGPCLIIT